MLSLGTEAPDLTLPDIYGGQISLSDYREKKTVLVIFMCNHCLYLRVNMLEKGQRAWLFRFPLDVFHTDSSVFICIYKRHMRREYYMGTEIMPTLKKAQQR